MSFKLRLLSVPELSFSAYIADISLTTTFLNTQNICFRFFRRVQMQESSQDWSPGIWCHVPIVWVTLHQIPWRHIPENSSRNTVKPQFYFPACCVFWDFVHFLYGPDQMCIRIAFLRFYTTLNTLCKDVKLGFYSICYSIISVCDTERSKHLFISTTVYSEVYYDL
jgi:hypothetical protein